MMFIKNKKNYILKKDKKNRIEKDINELDSLPKGIYAKNKFNENEQAYFIKIVVDKDIINIDKTNKIFATIPDVITFLIILDYCYPENPPKILCQTNVSKNKIYILLLNYICIVLFSKFNGWKRFISKYIIKMDSRIFLIGNSKNHSGIY